MTTRRDAHGSDMELARLTVDLDALRANYRTLAGGSGRTAAVVKADGYGLGAVRVVEALRNEDCGDYFVATVGEGITLRAAYSDVNIFVFSGPLDDASAFMMAQHRLTPVLNDEAQLGRWRRFGEIPAAVHVDTGMHRLGFAHDAVRASLFEGVNVALVLSHLACADVPDDPMNRRQVERFERLREVFPSALTSLANSAGALSGIESGITRAGIALYGGNAFSARPNPMLPVATLEAAVVALRGVAAGEPVGYGGDYTTSERMRLAVLGAGYADGVPRGLSADAEVALRGARIPIVGRVSMDLMQVDVTAATGAVNPGDWVEIFGRTIGIDETAAWAGTISYELLTRIGPRVRRLYIGQ